MDMSSEDENMAIDQRADASDASLDHASVVCNTTEEKVYIMAIIDLHPFLIRISTRITVARMTPRRREMAPRMSRDRGG